MVYSPAHIVENAQQLPMITEKERIYINIGQTYITCLNFPIWHFRLLYMLKMVCTNIQQKYSTKMFLFLWFIVSLSECTFSSKCVELIYIQIYNSLAETKLTLALFLDSKILSLLFILWMYITFSLNTSYLFYGCILHSLWTPLIYFMDVYYILFEHTKTPLHFKGVTWYGRMVLLLRHLSYK
jgi:hypothetical protein